jgi:hypothetical protein
VTGFPHRDPTWYFENLQRCRKQIRKYKSMPYRNTWCDGMASAALAIVLLRRLEPSAPWTGERFDGFAVRVRAAFEQFPVDFGMYRHRLDDDVLAENPNHWKAACFRRSAVQVLADDYGCVWWWDVSESRFAEDTDADMREVGPGRPAIDADDVPRGIPDGHWWWFIATGPTEELYF